MDYCVLLCGPTAGWMLLFVFIAARLRALRDVSLGWLIDHKGSDPLCKSPADPEMWRPSTSCVSLFVCSGDNNSVQVEVFVAQGLGICIYIGAYATEEGAI